jgi:basic amino acid/polyamine antiporter, APA family
MATNSDYRLAKVVGVTAVAASAVANEYGAGINFISVQSLGVYPAARDLVPLAMFVTGIIMLSKTLLFMRFSAAMPRAGSSYVWIGRSVSLPIGFVVSFVNWISFTAAMGFIAFVFTTFLATALGDLGINSAPLLHPMVRFIIGLIMIWGALALHLTGVRAYGRLVGLLLVFILISAATIIGYGFATSPAAFAAAVGPRTGLALATLDSTPATVLGFLGVCTLLVSAYAGISAAPSLGGEARDASRTVPRGILLGWGIALVLYAAVTAALFHVAPWWMVEALLKSGHSNYVTAPGLIGVVAPHWVSAALNIVIALVVGKKLLPQPMITSRMAFAFAEDGLFPRSLTRVSSRRVPVAALVLPAVLASLFLAQTVFVAWSVGIIVRSVAVLLVWFLVAVGAINVRFRARFQALAWAQSLRHDGLLFVMALVSLVLPVVLAARVLVVPNTPLVFQPMFQTLVAAVIGAALYAIAPGRADAGWLANALPLE